MTAQQGLVGRDDVLAVLEGGGEDFGRGVLAADELDDDVDGGVGDDIVPVARKGLTLNTGLPSACSQASAQARVSLRSMP